MDWIGLDWIIIIIIIINNNNNNNNNIHPYVIPLLIHPYVYILPKYIFIFMGSFACLYDRGG